MREFVETLGSGALEHAFDAIDRSAARFALESRHPFFDVRLIRFLAAVPGDQRRRGVIKFVLRNAMRGVLPEVVRTRDTKADFGHQFVAGVETLGGIGLFADGRSSISHRLNLVEMRRMYAEMTAAAQANNNLWLPHTWQLWLAAAIDLWHQKPPAVSASPDYEIVTGCSAPMEA
jgi:asparagine synthase (glutamine-hydrolysing)